MENLQNYFDSSDSVILRETPVGKSLYVNLIKPIKTKYGESLILYDLKHRVSFFSNSLLYSYLSKTLSDLKNSDGIYYKDDKMTTILNFKVKSVDKNKNGQLQVGLSFIKNTSTDKKPKILKLSDEENDIVEKNKKVFKGTNSKYLLDSDTE